MVYIDDTNIYQAINQDPTNKFQTQANRIVTELKNQNLISIQKEKQLKRHNSVSPKLYCLRKTHKNGLHLRPVVSCSNSSGYNIAKYLHEILYPLTTTFHFNIKDSFQFAEVIELHTIPTGHVLVSLDVVSLFTNVPKKLVLDIITSNFKFISNYTEIPKKNIIDLVSYCFDTSYFSYGGNVYLQKDGSAMGNPASPILANLVMNHLVTEVLKELPFDIPFIYVYVDDTVLSAPRDQLNTLLETFNSFHPSLQFTMEIEKEEKICFLDMEIHHQPNGTLITNWYSKPTSSGRLLNYLSNHPISNKIGIINGLLHRAINLSHPEFHTDNMEKVKKLLLNNNYPLNFINRSINKFKTKTTNIRKNQSNKYFKFPYIDGLSQKIGRCFGKTEVKLAFYNIKTTNSLFTPLKDKTPQGKRSSVVYRIQCECQKCYIGETMQYLDKRMQQHRYDCRNNRMHIEDKTALAKHHFQTGHQFKFNEVTIIDSEPQLYRRKVSEMIHISLNDTVNIKTDTTDGLSGIYNNILQIYKTNRIKQEFLQCKK